VESTSGSWWAEMLHPSLPGAHAACLLRLLALPVEAGRKKPKAAGAKKIWGYLARDGHRHTEASLGGHQDGLRSCRIFVFRDIQNSAGENTEQSQLAVPALS